MISHVSGVDVAAGPDVAKRVIVKETVLTFVVTGNNKVWFPSSGGGGESSGSGSSSSSVAAASEEATAASALAARRRTTKQQQWNHGVASYYEHRDKQPAAAMVQPDVGVKHGEIKQGKGIGGFTKTELPFDSAVKSAFKQAVKQHKKLKEVHVLIVKIVNNSTIVLDADVVCAAASAEAVQACLVRDAPRYQLVYGGKYKLPVFIYSCPSTSQRTDRMLYATTKQAVLDHITGLDKKHAPRKVEISDPEDLTDSDLTGIADKSAVPNAPVTKTAPKVEKFAPGELAGSLGSLMLGLNGQKPTGKKIIRPVENPP